MMITRKLMHKDVTVYVAGQVTGRPRTRALRGLRPLYAAIADAAQRVGANPRLPYWDPETDAKEPEAFVAEMRRRIDNSDAVITVLTGDLSPPIEGALAAESGKPQLIVSLRGAVRKSAPAPRLLVGLRGVAGIVEVQQNDADLVAARVTDAVLGFLRAPTVRMARPLLIAAAAEDVVPKRLTQTAAKVSEPLPVEAVHPLILEEPATDREVAGAAAAALKALSVLTPSVSTLASTPSDATRNEADQLLNEATDRLFRLLSTLRRGR